MLSLRRLINEAVRAANSDVKEFKRVDRRHKVAVQLIWSGEYPVVRVGLVRGDDCNIVKEYALRLGAYDFWPDSVDWLYNIPLQEISR